MVDLPDAFPKNNELVAPGVNELDANWLKKNFSGKQRAEAFRMFANRPVANIGDDFYYMSNLGLEYYLPVVLDYLKSPCSKGDLDFVSCTTNALADRQLHDQHHLSDVSKQLIFNIAEYIKSDLAKFDISPGQFTKQLEAMQKGGDPST